MVVAHGALLVDQDGGVLTLTDSDAPRNRMTLEYMDALEEAVRAAASDPSVRALVFTAAGDEHFSVGMDLKQLMGGAEERGGFEAVLDQALDMILRAKKVDGEHALRIGREAPPRLHR